MPWECRYHEVQPMHPEPGDMWPAPELVEGERLQVSRKHFLAEEYFRDWADKRPPLFVCLPNHTFFCVDSMPYKGGSGWTVTGTPPFITVSPSISNAPGEPRGYHGLLNNGVLSDDLDGRKFT